VWANFSVLGGEGIAPPSTSHPRGIFVIVWAKFSVLGGEGIAPPHQPPPRTATGERVNKRNSAIFSAATAAKQRLSWQS